MSEPPLERPGDDGSDSPDALLDAIRDRSDWSDAERATALDRLVASNSPEQIRRALPGRFGDLSGPHGEAVLALLEAFTTPELLDTLADTLDRQTDLSAERAGEILNLLAATGFLDSCASCGGCLEGPAGSACRREDVLGELARQIEGDPDGVWLALRSLAGSDPAERAAIVTGLASRTPGPGLVELLRLVCFDPDPSSRRAALAGLEAMPGDDPHVAGAWARIAAEHTDPGVAARGRAGLSRRGGATGRELAPLQPHVEGSLVTALDGRGRGHIVVRSRCGGTSVAAAFACDVFAGVLDVRGAIAADDGPARALVTEFAARPDLDVVEDHHELALGLLAGSLLLGVGPPAPLVRYWIERVAGPNLRPRPFAERDRVVDPDLTLAGAHALLDAGPGWLDESELTRELAQEWSLREPGAPPNPARDSGLIRFLFERRLLGRVELDRRRLTWMAAFWQASGVEDLARLARTAAASLSEPQNLVPGHPYFTALAVRSLSAAIGASPADAAFPGPRALLR
jgi:hypothetical protein